jgi:hypothetical protein
VDDQQPSQAFITALVTEHFVLQSARATTVSEAVGRSAVYLASVSGALVAFGFLTQTGHRFAVVGLVLPALVILGVFTFVRLVETSVENLVFLKRIEAIRGFYATLDPVAPRFFPSRADFGAATALASTGMRAGPSEMLFTTASMVGAITSMLIGAGAAVLTDAAGLPVPVTATVGAFAALLAFGLHILWMYRRGRSTM